MNKFIEYDIHNGITLLKCAIMNILESLDSVELDSYVFGPDISLHTITKCMYDAGWVEIDGIYYSPSKRDFIFTDVVDLTLELRT